MYARHVKIILKIVIALWIIMTIIRGSFDAAALFKGNSHDPTYVRTISIVIR